MEDFQVELKLNKDNLDWAHKLADRVRNMEYEND